MPQEQKHENHINKVYFITQCVLTYGNVQRLTSSISVTHVSECVNFGWKYYVKYLHYIVLHTWLRIMVKLLFTTNGVVVA